ncbi:MAG: SIS domain-containing protein [Candidatus Thorarchaeota archaeon]
MNSTAKGKTSAFKSAYQLLMRTANRSVNIIIQDPHNLAFFCQTLSNALENETRHIHIVAVGRSRVVGMIVGECLKNIGFSDRVAYLGENISHPVKKNDVVIAITGSGWTKLTTMVLEEVVHKKGIILTFTGALDSKAAKLSDGVLLNPQGYQSQDHLYLFTREQVPLSPLGTIFELTTLVTSLGVINGVHKGSCTNGFNEATTKILKIAESTYTSLKNDPKFFKFITFLGNYCNKSESKVFFFGSGINALVASMSSNRFQSLGMNVHSTNDWRFRDEGDLLIAISGSGLSPAVLNIAKSAKRSQMKIIGITSFSQSQLVKDSDEFLILEGRKQQTVPEIFQLNQQEMYIPKFEYVTALVLESCVAQIVKNLGIPDSNQGNYILDI